MVVCLNCRREGGKMVELICDHRLCLECAQGIKVAEGVGPLDAKYRVCCPSCGRNTTTLNIRNLLQEGSELLFINAQSSQLSEDQLNQQQAPLNESTLRKMSYTERRNNVQRKASEDKNERGSKASQDNKHKKELVEVKCFKHKEPLMFFCEQQAAVLCMQCMYRHMKEQKNHRVCSLADAGPAIAAANKRLKADSVRQLEDIQKFIGVCKSNKSALEQAFEVHSELVSQEFRQLEKLLKIKEQETKTYLQRIFQKKEKEVKTQLAQLSLSRNTLKQNSQFKDDSSLAQLMFFNNFTHTRIPRPESMRQLKKEELACFEKLTSVEDFARLLQKFYRPKADGRESKATAKESNAPSRASENGAKITKQQLQEKKKKLERLNKMEHEHKDSKLREQEYLNNYFIEDIPLKWFEGYQPDKTNQPNYRKSSASELIMERKTPQKTLTPTRTGAHTKMKKK